eukprot:34099_1
MQAHTQSFKCDAMAKYGTAGGALFHPLAITKTGVTASVSYSRLQRVRFHHCTWSCFQDACGPKMMAGIQTPSMLGSLFSLLYAFTLSASATLSRPRHISSASSSPLSWLACLSTSMKPRSSGPVSSSLLDTISG